MRIDLLDVELEGLAKWLEQTGKQLSAELVRKAIKEINSGDEAKAQIAKHENHKVAP